MKKVLIIGAGIVGMATGYQLLKKHRNTKLIIIEKEDAPARHQTGNNSGVIHSGIYYKPGGLKAENCRKGYKMLLDFAQENNIKHELCGKVMVAKNKQEEPILEKIFQRGQANGLKNIKKISSTELKEIEPYAQGVAGILVPETGIIDYVEVCEVLKKKITELGGEVLTKEAFKGCLKINGNPTVTTTNRIFHPDVIVNCSGLQSDRVAKKLGMEVNYKILPFRGEYYKLKKEKEYLIKNLIYPVPDINFPFLGVHFTRMVHGGIEAGPNAVLAFKREGYKFWDISFKDLAETLSYPGFLKGAKKYWRSGFEEMRRSRSKKLFTKSLQTLVPEITEHDIVSGGAGIRAQACLKNGQLVDDFMIGETAHIINVANAPSPAATSCLSIGEAISEKIVLRVS